GANAGDDGANAGDDGANAGDDGADAGDAALTNSTTAAEPTTAAAVPPAPADTTTPAAVLSQPTRSRLLLITAIVGVAALLIGAALFLLLPEPEKQPATRRRAEEVETADAALDMAGQLAAAGQYREAVRHLFLAALFTLAENRAITLDQSLTNHELLTQARDHPALVRALQPVIHTFDRVWYGYEPLTPADYETAAQQIIHLEKIR
ncbi:MAG: DUF4129 domain-containing protein, partial [Anaerolinea sp.]|nr:DUF4129 domain-containing protein [Anaerolinea sp.]